jgi:prepilin-type N-terminal cleavage/methylation domain-containing protein
MAAATGSVPGFTLIEMIAVLAVIAILAVTLVPAFIRKMDQIAGDKESASLKALGDALQSSVLRNRYVPSTNNWANTIAIESGINVGDVTMNRRRQPRVFLVDPAMQIGSQAAGQDYTQDNLGSGVRPNRPRIILLSSIGEPLPAGIVTGVPASTNDFNAIWNAADGTLPAGSPWTGWRGTNDLKVQRVNLSGLFVHVVLTSYGSFDGSSNRVEGRFAVDNGTLANAPRDTYFLQNSVLDLYSYTNTLDTRQILTRDISFVYQQNIWRASIEGLGSAGGLDIGTIVDRFLRAPHNPNALDSPNAQINIVQEMLDYMQAYQTWEDAGFPNNALRTAAVNAQDAMMVAVQGLYKHPNYFPIEVACPP